MKMPCACPQPSLALFGQENKLLILAFTPFHKLVTAYLPNLSCDDSLRHSGALAKPVAVPHTHLI